MLRTGGVGWGGAEYRARPRGAEVRRGLESEGVRKVCMKRVMRLLGEDPAKFKVRQGPERLYGRPALRRPPGGRAALSRCASRCGATVTGCLAVRRRGQTPTKLLQEHVDVFNPVALSLLQRALFVGG